MSTSTIIILAAIVIAVLCYTYYNYHAKHRHHYSDNQLKEAITSVFAGNNNAPVAKKAFLSGLKHRLECSHKEVLYLYGKAKNMGIIESDGVNVSLK